MAKRFGIRAMDFPSDSQYVAGSRPLPTCFESDAMQLCRKAFEKIRKKCEAQKLKAKNCRPSLIFKRFYCDKKIE
ncbi:MAG: hypothetical protein C4324_12090 [Blastocatellia bacterium]